MNPITGTMNSWSMSEEIARRDAENAAALASPLKRHAPVEEAFEMTLGEYTNPKTVIKALVEGGLEEVCSVTPSKKVTSSQSVAFCSLWLLRKQKCTSAQLKSSCMLDTLRRLQHQATGSQDASKSSARCSKHTTGSRSSLSPSFANDSSSFPPRS